MSGNPPAPKRTPRLQKGPQAVQQFSLFSFSVAPLFLRSKRDYPKRLKHHVSRAESVTYGPNGTANCKRQLVRCSKIAGRWTPSSMYTVPRDAFQKWNAGPVSSLHTHRSERIEARLSGTSGAFLRPDSSYSGRDAREFHFYGCRTG